MKLDGLCPPFDPANNSNLFGHYFGIEFVHNGHTYVRTISPFEFASCLCLTDKLWFKLSQPQYTFCLNAAGSGVTSARVFDQIQERCVHIHSSNFKIMEPNQYAAPAACIQTFLNGTVGIHLPMRERWVEAYKADKELSAILSFVENPGTISQRSPEAAKINTNYRQALRQSNLKLHNGILYYHKPIVGLESYAKLKVVPAAFRNIVFVAFHSNSLGGHLNAARTFHRIHLRF